MRTACLLGPCSALIIHAFHSSIRNHGGVPDIDPDAFELEIGGLVKTPIKLSLKELQDPSKFPYVDVNVVWTSR